MNASKTIFRSLLLAACALLLASCNTLVDRLSPEGGEPEAPTKFRRSAPAESPTKTTNDAWWKSYRDPVLNDLMDRVEANNPDVRSALARVDQAYAALGITGSERFPQLGGSTSFTQFKDSANNLRFPLDQLKYDQYRVAVNASWELDLWGRIRGSFRRDQFKAEATRAQYDDVLLSLRAALARQYFALRYARIEKAILVDGVTVREEALRLQETRVAEGAGVEFDASRARTELESTRVQAAELDRTTGKLEHAIAVLAGEAPADFKPSKGNTGIRIPDIPAGVPSELLNRRPDLRVAERNLRAAAEQIGIRKVEFLPRITLTGSGGVASLRTDNLFASPESVFRSIGPQVDVPLFQGGARKAAESQAEGAWHEAIENYRSVLLTAVQEVDDSLLDLQVLQRQIVAQDRAVASANETARLSKERFNEGFVSYFEVVDAERSRLEAQRIENRLRGERAATSVQLIQALGGSVGAN
ncbi:efflux transporter outer membrane subunit [Verrucomicrobiales bacterium BCK34]|nr:efflux transporter outer membrane subunit [Verrucomicrobiales bacterium BCK34]